MKQLSIRDYVARYRELGLNVIALTYGTKNGFFYKWKKYQKELVSVEQLKQWFESDYSKLNVGIVTGKISNNLVVVDFDDPKKYQEFEKEAPEFWDTFTVLTSKKQDNLRGVHKYFFLDEPLKSLIDTKKIRGFDIKGDGGFVIAPPSLHPSGEVYEAVDLQAPIKAVSQVELLKRVHLKEDQIEVFDLNSQHVRLRVGLEILEFNKGAFNRVFENEVLVTKQLVVLPLVLYPIANNGITYMFHIEYDRKEYFIEKLDELVRLLGQYKLTTNERKYIFEFFSSFLMYSINNDLYELVRDPITINEFIIIDYQVSKDMAITTLNLLNELYEITTDPNAFSTILSYAILMPLSHTIRKKGIRFFPLLFDGTAGTGKSAMQSLFIEQGFDQEAKRTIEDFRTHFAFVKNLQGSILPIMFDEITTDFIKKNASFFKSMVSGTGTASRGRQDLSLYTTEVTRAIAMSTNEMEELPEALQDRFLECQFSPSSKQRLDLKKYYDLVDQLPKGFMYVFLKTLQGVDIDTFFATLITVKDITALKQKYLEIGYNIVKNTYKQYKIECKIRKPILTLEKVRYWNEVFLAWLYNIVITLDQYKIEKEEDNKARLPYYADKLKSDIDYQIVYYGETTQIKIKLGNKVYIDFLRDYKNCPHKTLKSFANEYGYKYITLKIGGRAVMGIRVVISYNPSANTELEDFSEEPTAS